MAGDNREKSGFIERLPINIANSFGNAQRIKEDRVTAKFVVEKPRSREKATYPGPGSRTHEGKSYCTNFAQNWDRLSTRTNYAQRKDRTLFAPKFLPLITRKYHNYIEIKRLSAYIGR